MFMKPTIPIEFLSTQEFGKLYDRRLTQRQLAQSAFYHLYLQFEQNETVVARSVVSTAAQLPRFDDLVGNTTEVRFNFLNTDLQRIGFEAETWADMLDGDVFLERALITHDAIKGQLRHGILLPYDDGVDAVRSIPDMVREVMRRPRHRRDDSDHNNV